MPTDPRTLPAGYRTVGSSGLVVSELGIGASTFGRSGMRATSIDEVRPIVDTALELGVTYFDLAELYGGTISLETSPLGGLRARLLLPKA